MKTLFIQDPFQLAVESRDLSQAKKNKHEQMECLFVNLSSFTQHLGCFQLLFERL